MDSYIKANILDPEDIKRLYRNDGDTILGKLLLLTRQYPNLCNIIEDYCKLNIIEVNKYSGWYTPLYIAAVQCNPKHRIYLMQILLKYGANLNMRSYCRETILHGLVYYNDLTAIKLALNNGVNVNLQDGLHNSALNSAVGYCRLEATKLLLEYDSITNFRICHPPINIEDEFNKLKSNIERLNIKN